jgi:hypothetical protein
MRSITKFSTTTMLFVAVGIFAARVEANKVIEWNQLAQQHITGPPFSINRQFAMVQIAVADAVVAIEGGYEAFEFDLSAPRGASADAAVAQAAYEVLSSFFPSGSAARAAFDAKLAADLAPIPPGQRALGVEVGHRSAVLIIAARATDGFAAANPLPPAFPTALLPSVLPGIWIPTASGPATFSKLGDVKPFGVLTATQFLPDPPPQLESAEYAADFNEVKNQGERPVPYPTSCDDPSIAGRQRIALVWASAAPCASVTSAFRLWHNVARDIAQEEELSLVQTARLYALLTASIHDSVQTSQTSKFVYRLWRPETAIARAGAFGGDPDYDDNPATEGQPGWVPLLVTPSYPSQSSNMQCIGAGAARTLRNVFGTDNKSFTAVWYLNNTPTSPIVRAENYTSFWDLAVEEGNSRVWGGIHFTFELTTSRESCAGVADYIFANKMQRTAH